VKSKIRRLAGLRGGPRLLKNFSKKVKKRGVLIQGFVRELKGIRSLVV
jgi:hypothetical protein